jgi:hypothetical protein
MPGNDDRYLKEALDQITSGNNKFGLIFISALIWWLANLFPYNLSERTTRSLAARLDTLTALGSTADSTCSKAIDTYAGLRADAILQLAEARPGAQNDIQSCFFRLPTPGGFGAELSSLRQKPSGPVIDLDAYLKKDQGRVRLKQEIIKSLRMTWGNRNTKQLSSIAAELKSGRDECKKVFEQQYLENFKECSAARSEFVSFVDNWTKEGNIDVVGLKINNINVRWHPMALMLIIATGIVWLGFQRRRFYYLINESLQRAYGNDRKHGVDQGSLLLKVPWWLLPVPDFRYRNGRTLRELLAAEGEYRRSLLTAGIILVILCAMFSSGINAQRLLSMNAELNALSPNLKELGDFEHASLGLLGSTFVDVFFLSVLIFVPAGILWWVVPAAPARFGGTGVQITRRQSLRAVALIAASLAVPLVVKPDALKSIFRIRTRSNPYQKRRPRLATYPGAPGWYWNIKAEPQIGHFVKPEIVVKHRAKWWPPRLGFVVKHPAGRIKGGGKIDSKRLVAMQPREISSVIPNEKRLNANFYSEGIEQAALESWREGARADAIEILRVGLSYTSRQKDLDIRLYDLLAGLLVRERRDKELTSLMPAIEARIARIERILNDPKAGINLDDRMRAKLVEESKSRKRSVRLSARHRIRAKQKLTGLKAAMEARLAAWSAAEGKWKAKWQSESKLKWNGLDI